MKIVRKRLSELNPAPYNPRKDLQPYDEEYEKLKRSVQEFGYVEPIIWNERTGYVVGGHQRLKVLRQLGETEIDCVVVDLPSDREAALNVALNKIGNDWDDEKLKDLLSGLQNTEIDVTLTGFSGVEIDKVLKIDAEDEAVDKYYGDERERTYNNYRLHEYDVSRTAGYYQLPTLKACHYVPEDLIGFNYVKSWKGNREGLGVHFFLDDYQFERIWSNPYKYIEKLREFSCVVMPDFSTYWDMPMAMKIWNLYRMRLISQVMQDAGLQVLPVVRSLGDETLSWSFEGIEPGGVLVYSTVGIAGSHDTFKEICQRELSYAIKELKPENIVHYGKDIGLNFHGVPVKRIDFRRWGA